MFSNGFTLILGYPDKKKLKSTKKGRLSGVGIIHFSKYQRLNGEELKDMVLEYDSQDKHFLSLIDGWREKGYRHYLEYFYEKWCGCVRVEEKSNYVKESNNPYNEVEKVLMITGFLSDQVNHASENIL